MKNRFLVSSLWLLLIAATLCFAIGERYWLRESYPQGTYGITYNPNIDRVYYVNYTTQQIYIASSDSFLTSYGTIPAPNSDSGCTDIKYCSYDNTFWVLNKRHKTVYKINTSGTVLRSFSMASMDYPFLETTGESLYTKSRSRNQMIIYGLEISSAGVGALIPHLGLYSINKDKQWVHGPERWFCGIGYALTTTATTTATTYLTGKLFNQGGNWHKAAIGAGIAGTVVSFVEYNYHRFGVEYCLLPMYGAVVGYNWDRDKFLRQMGIYTLEGMGGCTGLGISLLIAGVYYGMNYEYMQPEDCIPLYTISNMIFTSTTTTITSRLFKQRGSWWKSIIGAGVGALISSYHLHIYETHDSKPWPKIAVISLVLLPPAGAVSGYNLR